MKKPITTNSNITSAIRRLWLRSRERAQRLKKDNYTCQTCNSKQSRKKGSEVYVQVHHIDGIKWKEIIEYIRKNVLVDEDKLETLCKECHKDIRKKKT